MLTEFTADLLRSRFCWEFFRRRKNIFSSSLKSSSPLPHLTRLDDDDSRVFIILFLLLFFGVDAVELHLKKRDGKKGSKSESELWGKESDEKKLELGFEPSTERHDLDSCFILNIYFLNHLCRKDEGKEKEKTKVYLNSTKMHIDIEKATHTHTHGLPWLSQPVTHVTGNSKCLVVFPFLS